MFPQETIKKKAAKAEPLAEFEDSLRILDGSTADHGWNISIAWSVVFLLLTVNIFVIYVVTIGIFTIDQR